MPGEAAEAVTAAQGHPLNRLLEVQDLDTAISQLVRRKAGLPGRQELAAVEEKLADAAARLRALDDERADLTARQAEIEKHMTETTTHRKTVEQRLYSARGMSSRDLQAMDEEIRHLGERLGEMEEADLVIMVELEPVDAATEKLTEERTELSASADVLRNGLAADESVIDAEIAEQSSARSAAAEHVPEKLLERYEVLRCPHGRNWRRTLDRQPMRRLSSRTPVNGGREDPSPAEGHHGDVRSVRADLGANVPASSDGSVG